jgi:hypothetical protein
MNFNDRETARRALIQFLAGADDHGAMRDAIHYLERAAPEELLALRDRLEESDQLEKLSCEQVASSLANYAAWGDEASRRQPSTATHLETCDNCRADLEFLRESADDSAKLLSAFENVLDPESAAAAGSESGDRLVLISSAWHWVKSQANLAASQIVARARAGAWSLMPVPLAVQLGPTPNPLGFSRVLPGKAAKLSVEVAPSSVVGEWKIRFEVEELRAEFMTIAVQRGEKRGGSRDLSPGSPVEFFEPPPVDAPYQFFLEWQIDGRRADLSIELPVTKQRQG